MNPKCRGCKHAVGSLEITHKALGAVASLVWTCAEGNEMGKADGTCYTSVKLTAHGAKVREK